MTKDKVILNLGCGKLLMKDAINVDAICLGPTDKDHVFIEQDIIEFLRDYSIDSVREIHLYYILEHLSIEEVFELTYLLNKVLVIGGRIFGIVPDFDQISARYQLISKPEEKVKFLMKYSYEICGTADETLHKSCWNGDLIAFIFERDGFEIKSTIMDAGSKRVGIYFVLEKIQHCNITLGGINHYRKIFKD